MNILLVVCHPRMNSLTFNVASAFKRGALQSNHKIELVDLYRENFNPVLNIEDEPSEKGMISDYSKEVQMEFARLNRNDAVVMVFPLWWWSMPAMLKGWIDRVWNFGLTYGPSAKHNVKKCLMITLSGNSHQELQKEDYDKAVRISLDLGISHYNNILQSELVVFDNTILGNDHCSKHIDEAFNLGLEY